MTSWFVKWDVLDQSGSVIGQLGSTGGSVSWDGSATIQRVARDVRFDADEWADVNPFTDRLRLMFYDGLGSATPMGVFHVAGLPVVHVDGTTVEDPTPYLVDGGFFLDQPSTTGFAGRLGERLSEVMARICGEAGITDRVISPCGEFCGEPILSPPGETYRRSLAGITQLANFLPPHFDANGTLRLVPPPPLGSEPVAFYDSSNIIRMSRVEDENLLDAPNVFLVLGTGASQSPIVAEVEVPSSAPHSVANRNGRRIVAVAREQGIDSEAQALRMAQTLALRQFSDYRVVTFDALPNPAHDCYQIVEVNDERYRQTGWDLPLSVSGSVMSHQLDRADPTGDDS